MAVAAGSITLALQTARSGLLTTQSALNTVAHNIANANTPNYSRKIVNPEQKVLAGFPAGVQISDVTRQVDEGLLKSLRLSLSDYQRINVQTTYYERSQEMFQRPADNTSISHFIADFAQALESLSLAPGGSLEQSEAVRWGNEIALKLNGMTSSIQELRRQADREIADSVDIINNQIANIGDLNDKIIRNQAVGLDVTDLKDQRDAALDQLSEVIDIRYFSRGDGDVVVFTSGGRTIVDNVPATLTHNAAASVDSAMTHAAGGISGIYVGAVLPTNDITGDIRSGKLKGLIELRDNVLTGFQSELDELAAELRDAVNMVHNRGVAFPGMQSATGTRLFVAPTVQTITLDPTAGADDVTISLFNSTGDQQAVTKLETIMTSAAFGSGAQAANGPWTVSEVALKIEDWLQANGAATASVTVNSVGKFDISLNTSSVSLAFRDESASAVGSTHEDAEIGFDANGDGTIDERIRGFSNFFGLNDFFVDNLGNDVHESNVMSSSFTGTAATLSFRDSTGVLAGSPVAITSGMTLTQIATAINNAVSQVTATVVPDGSGQRLRISHADGSNLVVTQAAGNTLLTDLGMHVADVRVAGALSVRSEILTTPGNMARGAIQWDSALGTTGRYYLSAGDDTIAKALAEAMTSSNSFDQAGGQASLTSSFDEYAAAILGRNASLADANKTQKEYTEQLTDAIKHKSDTIRGVNVDEEMASLILLEQAYSASARVITVINQMFEALENIK